MAITVGEKIESQRSTAGPGGGGGVVEFEYWIRGTSFASEARAALLAKAPPVINVGGVQLGIETVSLDPVYVDAANPASESNIWTGIVRYSGFGVHVNDSAFTFDTGGGTAHFTHGRRGTQVIYGDDAPDPKGGIGATADSVEGVDIAVPVFEFTLSRIMPPIKISIPTIYFLTGCVNSSPFGGFAAGEVLFRGATGSQRGLGDFEMVYRFAAAPNAGAGGLLPELEVDDIGGIVKGGWDHLWVRSEPGVSPDGKSMIMKPIGVYVETGLYRRGNLNLLFPA